jgi:hypothetical protein
MNRITPFVFSLFALFTGFETLPVSFIVSLLLGFLVVIVKKPASRPSSRPHGQSQPGVARNRPDNPAGGGADGCTTQRALFGVRHARASTERKAKYQQND